MQRRLNPYDWFKRYAIYAPWVACALVVWPVAAQDAAATASQRIEQMRDQSASDRLGGADASAQSGLHGEAEQAAQEPEPPLPPNEALPLGAGEGDLFSGDAGQTDAGSLGDGWVLSTLAALGVVLALVFGIRWMLRRGGVVSISAPQGSVVEVLSRTTVAPRSHVVLMRVGQRILVVSDSPAGMRTLASVHEAEEVAELLGAVDASKATSMSQNFGSVMKKLSGQWSSEEDDLAGDPEISTRNDGDGMDQTHGALASVRGRLAALSDAGGRA